MRFAHRSFPGQSAFEVFVSALSLVALTLAITLGIGFFVPSDRSTHRAAAGASSGGPP
jgi:hypothetical protein